VALDLSGAFAQAREGEVPDLAESFNAHGARHDSTLAATRDELVGTIEATITRAFRSAFLLSPPLQRSHWSPASSSAGGCSRDPIPDHAPRSRSSRRSSRPF